MSLSEWLVVTPNVLLLNYAGPVEALRMAGSPQVRWEKRRRTPSSVVRASIGEAGNCADSVGTIVRGADLSAVSGLVRRRCLPLLETFQPP